MVCGRICKTNICSENDNRYICMYRKKRCTFSNSNFDLELNKKTNYMKNRQGVLFCGYKLLENQSGFIEAMLLLIT